MGWVCVGLGRWAERKLEVDQDSDSKEGLSLEVGTMGTSHVI